MTDQLEMFTSAVQMLGNCSHALVSRSLVFISVGSNDLFEYVDGNATSCPGRNDTKFLQGLVAAYRGYLQVRLLSMSYSTPELNTRQIKL